MKNKSQILGVHAIFGLSYVFFCIQLRSVVSQAAFTSNGYQYPILFRGWVIKLDFLALDLNSSILPNHSVPTEDHSVRQTLKFTVIRATDRLVVPAIQAKELKNRNKKICLMNNWSDIVLYGKSQLRLHSTLFLLTEGSLLEYFTGIYLFNPVGAPKLPFHGCDKRQQFRQSESESTFTTLQILHHQFENYFCCISLLYYGGSIIWWSFFFLCLV